MIHQRNLENLNDILKDIRPEFIPPAFVNSAQIIYENGTSDIISNKELEKIMDDEESLEIMGIKTIKLIIDMVMVKKAIMDLSGKILQNISL